MIEIVMGYHLILNQLNLTFVTTRHFSLAFIFLTKIENT
jgi:hypothetical protein